jgi:hypothetical protein
MHSRAQQFNYNFRVNHNSKLLSTNQTQPIDKRLAECLKKLSPSSRPEFSQLSVLPSAYVSPELGYRALTSGELCFPSTLR